MKYSPSIITALALVLAGCSGGGSDSEPQGSEELRDAATIVTSTDGLPSCSAATKDSLYYITASQSYRTCVDQGTDQGYGFVDVNTTRTAYDGAEQVLSFRSYDRLPWCGWWRRGLVAYVSATKELKYCGRKRGYRWWFVWKTLNISTNSTNDGACSVVETSPGVRTITCGDTSAQVYDGKDGVDGQDGADGVDGADGTDGADGADGPNGADGAQGPKGDKGDKGADGQDGAQGPKGETGEPGTPGTDGAPGPKGETGEPGTPGTDGAQGPKGETGEPGTPGTDGAQGPKGEKGEPGTPGTDGAQGPKGEKGDQGDKGDAGQNGAKGEKGEKGDPGTDGAKGEKGEDGEDGVGCSLVPNGDGTHTLTCGSDSIVVGNRVNAFVQMSSGVYHTCGVSPKSEVWCWGSNEYGQLGRNLPTVNGAKGTIGKVPGLTGVKKIVSGSYFTCAQKDSGEVFCWGDNADGQLGFASPNVIPSPVQIVGMTGAKDIETGQSSTCAIGTDDQVRCFGDVRLTGANTLTIGSNLTAIPGLSGIASLAVGPSSICGLSTNGDVLCRGSNSDGQTGQPLSVDFVETATTVTGLSGTRELRTGGYGYCTLDTNQAIFCWGSNVAGETGQPLSTSRFNSPVQVTSLPDSKALYAGPSGYCALSPQDELRCWGYNLYGSLGTGSSSPLRVPTPQLVLGGLDSPIEAVFGSNPSPTRCLKTASRRTFCWGEQTQYDRDTVPTAQPAPRFGPWELDLNNIPDF